MSLLDTLRRYQHYDDATRSFVEYRSARDYARRLGLNHSHLTRVFNGERPIGTKVLRAFVARYPQAAGSITLDAVDA